MQWDEFETNLFSTFAGLRREEHFSDVTLVSEDGHLFKAHKVLLSATSLILDKILKSQDHPKPLIFLGGASRDTLSSLLDFIYFGKVEITAGDQLYKFMALANKLKVKGLSKEENGKKNEHVDNDDLEDKKSEWSKWVKKLVTEGEIGEKVRRKMIYKHTSDLYYDPECKCECCKSWPKCKCWPCNYNDNLDALKEADKEDFEDAEWLRTEDPGLTERRRIHEEAWEDASAGQMCISVPTLLEFCKKFDL